MRRARGFKQLSAEFAGSVRAIDHGPVDHELLRARPFDETHCDPLMRAGPNRSNHLTIGDRRGIALALRYERGMLDVSMGLP